MRRSLLLLFAFVLVPTLAFGQAQTTGRIAGKVVDDTGAPVAGATVTVENQELKLERTAETSASGEFLFAVLPTGSYTVTATKAGMQPEVYSLRVGIGQTVPVDLTLRPGEAVRDEVTVYGAASVLETTTIGESFNYDNQVEGLPIQDRTIEEVAELSPNISFGPTGGTLSISGAPSFDTVVLLDGAEVSDPYFGSSPELYLEDAIEEVQVLTSGVSARYGRFQGGVINAVTKSGTNEFNGILRTEFQKESWDSQTPFGETQTDDLNKTYYGTVGGFVVKDRLWFFAGGRTYPTLTESETTQRTSESFTSTSEEDRWQGKLSAALTPSHLVDVSHLSFDATTDNYDGLPPGDDLALGQRADPRETTTLSYQGVLSARSFLDLQATRKKVRIQAGGDPAKGDPFIDLVNFQVFHNHWWDFTDASVRDSDTAAAGLTQVFDSSRWGAHTLEGGVQYVQSTTGGENRQSSTGFNLLTLNPDFIATTAGGNPRFNLRTGNALRWEAIPLGGDQKLENTALYLQDGITFDKWRFDVGLRYDKYEGTGPLPEFDLSFDDIAPRLGVTYSITPDWQVQATYGKYVSRFNDSVANNVTGVSSGPSIQTIYLGPDILNASAEEIQAAVRDDANWPAVIGFSSPEFPTTFLAEGINAPYANDFNLSVRRALPNNTGNIVLSYINREYKELIDNFVGGVCDFGLEFGQPCPAGNTTSVPLPDGSGNAVVDTIVWANNPDARREYEALTAVVHYRPSHRWQIGGNYTYSRLRGNYEGEGENTPASGSPLGNFERSVDLAAATPFGTLLEDIPHRLNVIGTYRWDFLQNHAFTVGSVVRYQSGLPYNLQAEVPLTDDPEYVAEAATYTHYFDDLGSHRFEDWWRLDLSGRYELPIFRDLQLGIKGSVINLLNNDAVVEFSTAGRAVTNPTTGQLEWRPVGNCGPNDEPSKNCTGFGRIRSESDYQDPRTYLVSLSLEF